MSKSCVAFTKKAEDFTRSIFENVLGESAEIIYLADLQGNALIEALKEIDVLIGVDVTREIGPENIKYLEKLRFIQLLIAGVDFIAFKLLPKNIPIACNRGHTALPMAEHTVAMALACARRLRVEHLNMQAGEFNQFSGDNRMLRGGICTILGFGEVGRAAAQIFRALGMKIYAINRSGKTDTPVDFIGTLDNLEEVLRIADVIIVSIALTPATKFLIRAREFSWTKDNAILINVSRGEIIDEHAFYEHLKNHPAFFAGIDAWWEEPVRHGVFRMEHPFLDLPNVIGSPHNSSNSPNSREYGFQRAVENVHRFLKGKEPRFLVRDDERMK